MEIKCGRRTFTVTEKDRILDNGACYQLITQRYFDGWYRAIPMVAKTTFKKLLKEGKIRLTSEKYHGYNDMRLYQFVTEKEN